MSMEDEEMVGANSSLGAAYSTTMANSSINSAAAAAVVAASPDNSSFCSSSQHPNSATPSGSLFSRELRDFATSNQTSIQLSYLVERIVTHLHDRLEILIQLLPGFDDYEKTVKICEFTKNSFYLNVKLIALLKWIIRSQKLSVAFMIENHIRSQESIILQIADQLARLSREFLVNAKLPIYAVNQALEILHGTENSYLPMCIRNDILQEDFQNANLTKEEVTEYLNEQLLYRFVEDELDCNYIIDQISNGQAILVMPNKYKVILTLVGSKEKMFWKIKSLSFDICRHYFDKQDICIHNLQKRHLITQIENRMFTETQNDQPSLPVLYLLLNSTVNCILLDILYNQFSESYLYKGCQSIVTSNYDLGESITFDFWRRPDSIDQLDSLDNFKHHIKFSSYENGILITDDSDLEHYNNTDLFDHITANDQFSINYFFNSMMRMHCNRSMLALDRHLSAFFVTQIENIVCSSKETSFVQLLVWPFTEAEPLVFSKNIENGIWMVTHSFMQHGKCKKLIHDIKYKLNSVSNDDFEIYTEICSLALEITIEYIVNSARLNNFKILSEISPNETTNSSKIEVKSSEIIAKRFVRLILGSFDYIIISLYGTTNPHSEHSTFQDSLSIKVFTVSLNKSGTSKMKAEKYQDNSLVLSQWPNSANSNPSLGNNSPNDDPKSQTDTKQIEPTTSFNEDQSLFVSTPENDVTQILSEKINCEDSNRPNQFSIISDTIKNLLLELDIKNTTLNQYRKHIYASTPIHDLSSNGSCTNNEILKSQASSLHPVNAMRQLSSKFTIIDLFKKYYHAEMLKYFEIKFINGFQDSNTDNLFIYYEMQLRKELSKTVNIDKGFRQGQLLIESTTYSSNSQLTSIDSFILNLMGIIKILEFNQSFLNSLIDPESENFTLKYSFNLNSHQIVVRNVANPLIYFSIIYNPPSQKFLLTNYSSTVFFAGYNHISCRSSTPSSIFNRMKNSSGSWFASFLKFIENQLNDDWSLKNLLINLDRLLNQTALIDKLSSVLNYGIAFTKKLFFPAFESIVIADSVNKLHVLYRNKFKLRLILLDSNTICIESSPSNPPVISNSDMNRLKNISDLPLSEEFLHFLQANNIRMYNDESGWKIFVSSDVFKEIFLRSTDENAMNASKCKFINLYAMAMRTLFDCFLILSNEKMQCISFDNFNLKFQNADLHVELFMQNFIQDPILKINITQSNPNQVVNYFSQDSIYLLTMYIFNNVFAYPHKYYLFLSFIRLFKFPRQILADTIQLINLENERQQTGANVNVKLSLTFPYGCLTAYFSIGSSSIAVRNRCFLMFTLSYKDTVNVNSNDLSGKDSSPESIEKNIAIPFIYDIENNTMKVLENATKTYLQLAQIQELINKFLKEQAKDESKTCILYSCLKFVMKNLGSVHM